MSTTHHIVLGLTLFLVSFTAGAQQLRDPTRPPDGNYTGSSTSRAVKSRPRSGMVLQTVLISVDRRAAIISGRLMSVGDTISGYRLTEIREGAVVIKGRDGTRTLQLFPSVHKVGSKLATVSEKKKGQQ